MVTEINTGGGGDGNKGGNTIMGFLLGGVLVAVAVVGFFMWDNYKSHTGGAPTTIVKIEKK